MGHTSWSADERGSNRREAGRRFTVGCVITITGSGGPIKCIKEEHPRKLLSFEWVTSRGNEDKMPTI